MADQKHPHNNTSFILASASPRRLELLNQIGCTPKCVVPANIDEYPLPKELPRQVAKRLAAAKASAIAAMYPDEVVLAADTVVACGRRVLPKVETEQEAAISLQLLSGRRHRVFGGICVTAPGGYVWERLVETSVAFRRLSSIDISVYTTTEEWRGKAGGYAIQGKAGTFVRSINGSYTNIVGLCVFTTLGLLKLAWSHAHH